MYCRVLAGHSEDFLSGSTAVWLEETELRSGVDYMLSPGAKLSFGVKGENTISIEFDEGAEGGGMAQMMMNVMAQGVCTHNIHGIVTIAWIVLYVVCKVNGTTVPR